MSAARGLILAAPKSGSGKTVITLGLLRHWRRSGIAVAPFKAGPDYIDAAYHSAASGRACVNLDTWAMRAESLDGGARALAEGAEFILGEGVMGLFDGSAGDSGGGGSGSTADLAAHFGLPVVLVVDARGQGASVAALAEGFAHHRDDVELAAVIFNHVAGARHEEILRAAMAPTGIAVLGALPRASALDLPARHLGLVQAEEAEDLQAFLDGAADIVARHVDSEALGALGRPLALPEAAAPPCPLEPLSQKIAVARDSAFAFCYEAVLSGWRQAGAEIGFFSPLADEAPDPDADAIYLPGGYPELHAGRLTANRNFIDGLRGAAKAGTWLYGECGGYMVLGDGLIDGDGERHAMAGLLPLETSFAAPSLHLGYREAEMLSDAPFAANGARFRGHEFHYAAVTHEGDAQPLFRCADSAGKDLGESGLAAGKVMGSFIHLIDRC